MDQLNAVVRILAVSSNESQLAALARILGHTTWVLETADSLSSADQILNTGDVQVMLCDQQLPDGTWKDALLSLSSMPIPPELVILSASGDDRLWAEVLNLGAWDMLVTPFYPKEVFRTIHLAWQHWMDSSRRCANVGAARKPAAGASAPRTLIAGVS
jgi:DNA-binding response OmpR family regulator